MGGCHDRAPHIVSLGPLMVGIAGGELGQVESEVLRHPSIGGVILFSRNYRSRGQLRALCNSIHALRQPSLLIAVDHEGGRVQRFRDGFTALPTAAKYGILHDRNQAAGCRAARSGGWVMAVELRASGVDFSFAPVLDLGLGVSSVIGDRAFHRAPDVVTALARAFLSGMRDAGVAGVGKHFPGHGSVTADSHHVLPVDCRPYEDLRVSDLVPFERLASSDLSGVMPAHVVFECLDDRPAGFSRLWIGDILRGRLGFQGIVFSDDLDMAGAATGGDHLDRAHAALEAGCDMVLVCNDWSGAVTVVEGLKCAPDPVRVARMARMQGRGAPSFEQLASDPAYRSAVAEVSSLVRTPECDLGDDRRA